MKNQKEALDSIFQEAVKEMYGRDYVLEPYEKEGLEEALKSAYNLGKSDKPKSGLDYEKLSKDFDKLLAETTKEDIDAWLKMDEDRTKRSENDKNK